MRTVSAVRQVHSQYNGLPPPSGASFGLSCPSMYCTGQDVSSAWATAACAWRWAMAWSIGSHSLAMRRSPCESVETGTRKPSAARSRAAAAWARNRTNTCTRNQPHTLVPSCVRSPSRSAGGASTGRAAAHEQAGRYCCRRIRRATACQFHLVDPAGLGPAPDIGLAAARTTPFVFRQIEPLVSHG